jgi:RNA polymerase sigma-70 factor (ECF subfamily)
MEVKSIHHEFHKLLSNYISVRINDRDDAADVLQEVFIKIALRLSALTNKEKLKSWIFAITRNAITDYYRKNAGRINSGITDTIMDETADDSDTDTTQGLDRCLQSFIGNLPAEYRDIIIDSEIQGIKQKDLAVKYNLAYPSVRSRVQRGRTRLKEMFVECCKIETDSRGNILEVAPKTGCRTDCGDLN